MMNKIIINIIIYLNNKDLSLQCSYEYIKDIFHNNNMMIDNHINIVESILRIAGFTQGQIDLLELRYL